MTHVVIVGGGIAGMALAGLLEQETDYEYTVIEQAEAFGRVGYGIALWQNGISVLRRLGVDDDVLERASDLDILQIRSTNGELLNVIDMSVGDQKLLAGVHRADIHDALLSVVPEDRIVMNTRPTELERNEDRVIVCTDDNRFEADIVIGADGVHSWVRETVFGKSCRETDTEVWSFWAPKDIDFPDELVSLWSHGIEVLTSTVDDRGLVNIEVTVDDDISSDDALQEAITQIGWVIQDAYEHIDRDVIFHDTVKRVTIPEWVSGRVGLMGDAAHALSPISGMGASMALKDAAALVDELQAVDSTQFPDALERYEERRKPDIRQARREELFLQKSLLSRSRLVHRMMRVVWRHIPLGWYYRKRLRNEFSDKQLNQ